MIEIRELIGNKELLQLPKTAFLCSRKVPANVVLKCYDWAIAQREAGNCIISGFHSQLEKDVFHYLLKGKQPIIIALARGMKKKMDPILQQGLQNGRLLIVTPFDTKIERVTEETAATRNRLMIGLADEIVIGHASQNGNLIKLIQELWVNKPIYYLNQHTQDNAISE
jgi:predicted Rossmann fold nucleotide-binding protein DprA/Smf involved in DNA uptake